MLHPWSTSYIVRGWNRVEGDSNIGVMSLKGKLVYFHLPSLFSALHDVRSYPHLHLHHDARPPHRFTCTRAI
jgi:hypothetical protein